MPATTAPIPAVLRRGLRAVTVLKKPEGLPSGAVADPSAEDGNREQSGSARGAGADLLRGKG